MAPGHPVQVAGVQVPPLIETSTPVTAALSFAEPLITLAKQDSVANRRRAFSALRDDKAVQELFLEIGPAFTERPGGYTRILKLGPRYGDAAPLARIELVGLGEHEEE